MTNFYKGEETAKVSRVYRGTDQLYPDIRLWKRYEAIASYGYVERYDGNDSLYGDNGHKINGNGTIYDIYTINQATGTYQGNVRYNGVTFGSYLEKQSQFNGLYIFSSNQHMRLSGIQEISGQYRFEISVSKYSTYRNALVSGDMELMTLDKLATLL